MVEKRFDLLTVESYNKVIKRCRELINKSEFDEIEKEFGYPTNAVWETSGDFLNPASSDGETLDILHFSMNEYTDKDAYLYLTGDVESEDGAMLCYLVRNSKCDVYGIGKFNSIEELVTQIKKEYNAMVYYNDLFKKVEELRTNNDKDLEDLCEIYSVDINSDYLFENLDTFFEAYINQNSRLNSVYTAKKMCNDLEKLINNN